MSRSGRGRRWTERARREACWLVGEDGLDVTAVADQFGVCWSTVMRAVRDYGEPLTDDPTRLAGMVAVAVDKTTFRARGRARARGCGQTPHPPATLG